jgi:hypothetical protein
MTITLSVGPKLVNGEKGVHIIYVSAEMLAGEAGGGQGTTVALQQVAKLVGNPAVTDVVVFAGEPWHVVNHELKAHPQVHKDYPETVLRIHRLRDETVVWWSEKPFTITAITPEPPKKRGKPEYPFAVPATRPEDGSDNKAIFVARSDVPIKEADDQEYKIAFKMEGQSIDPNMYCDPAP